MLIYFETTNNVKSAIAREKQIKAVKKKETCPELVEGIALIESMNKKNLSKGLALSEESRDFSLG